MDGGPLVPMWFGLSSGLVLMVVVWSHLIELSGRRMPASRRRIRQANGGLMLVLIPLLVAGFSIIDPQGDTRLWAAVWFSAIALLGFVLFFAVADATNTWRLRRRRRALIESLTDEVLGSAESASAGQGPGAGG